MKIIDLSKSIETGMQEYPGDPKVEIDIVHTMEDKAWELRELRLGTHTGTHVDAFSHMHEDGKTIDNIPLASFFGSAQVVDPDEEFPRGIGLIFTKEIGLGSIDKLLDAGPKFVGGSISEELERALVNYTAPSDVASYEYNACSCMAMPVCRRFSTKC